MNVRRLVATAASLCLLASSPFAQSPARYPLPPEWSGYAREIGEGRAAVASLIDTKQIPGFSIAVAHDGAIIWSEGFGLSDVEQRVPVTPLTRFRVGSVSKVLTAAAVAQLVEAGKLDLDAPVQRYVPSFPAKPWPVTTRQLTGHTSGIRHYAQDHAGPLKGAPHFATIEAGLAIFQKDPLLFEPGTSYTYSSYAWNLVSAVIERASGEEFLSYMQRAVFTPLGLRSITADHAFAIVPNRTRFYARSKAGVLIHADFVDNSYKWAGGGFLSSAEDLARFGSAHLQPGFLRPAALDLLFTSQRLRSGKETGVGIAWRSGTDSKGRRVLHHGGSIAGGRAMLMMFPDSKVVVAMLSNIYVDFGEQDAQRIGDLFIR